MFKGTDRFAVSASLGNGIGGDVTVKLPAKLYITGSAVTSGKWVGQLILQRRLADGNPIGLSLGATVRQKAISVPYELEEEQCRIPLFCAIPDYNYFRTTSLGFRGVLMLTGIYDYGESRGFFYLTASYNYDLDMETGYPKIGLALGLY